MTDRIGTERWARAKAAYLAGETAGTVCTHFRIGRSAFFAAAQAGGWRRSDQAAGGDIAEERPAPPGEALPCIDLADAAMARASDAVMGGRLSEAQGWTRLAGELRRLALQETGQESWVDTLGHAIDQEAHGHYMADRLTEQAPRTPDSGPDSPDSSWTPVSAATHENNSDIGAEPDSVDCPAQTGLRTASALPRNLEDMHACVQVEAARMEQSDRALHKAGP